MEKLTASLSFNIHSAGNGCHIRFGDLTCNGCMDFLLIKPDHVSDERFFSHRVVCATAFSADGSMLWQIGDPEYDSPEIICDLPAQIYDIDRDGKNEAVLIMGDELLVLDGKTGEIKRKIELPDKLACDSITFADLDGTGYAQNIIIKNKYSMLWVLDSNLNIIKTFEGNIGRTPIAYDINDDGRDEIIAGYNILSSDLTPLWKANMSENAKSVCLCKSGGSAMIIFSGPYVRAYTVNGEFLWDIDASPSSICSAKFRDDTAKSDILLMDSLSMYDIDGSFVMQKNGTVYLPTLVYNFDKTEKFYIAGHKKEDIETTVYDGYMRPLYTLDSFGNIACADILGDGSAQIIIYNDDTLRIYSYDIIDISAPVRSYTRPQQRRYYNYSVLNHIPYIKASAEFIQDDFATQNILKWASSYANVYIHSGFAKVTRAEFVTLMISLLNIKEDYYDNFADVYPDSSYYPAIGTAKKLGIVESTNNLFHPDDLITTKYANSVLEKLGVTKSFGFDGNYILSKQDLARFIVSLSEH